MSSSKNVKVEFDSKPLSFLIDLKNHIKSLSFDEIARELPGVLKELCNYLVDENEKEVFLIGALGVISGLLPNVVGLYSGKGISPNLYVYVLAGYGGGKGGLDFARKLGEYIHKEKRDRAKILLADYLKEMEVYKKELKEYNKSKDKDNNPPVKPVKPPTLMLYIPANNSKSGVYQLLEENEGQGIIFESEGDTLADALKQDYGNFSDTLRKAFHHEYLDLFRRLNNELIEIENPKLSVVLSSTFNQLKTLIPSIENGLFSRFLFYELKQNNKFVNVFDDSKNHYQEIFNSAGFKFKKLYDELASLEIPIWFNLTKKQQSTFLELFDEKKAKMIEEIDVTMAGTANRLGIIAFRIMMILTTIRASENGILNNSIVCSDIDFQNALRIVERLEKHAKTVFDFLNGQPEKKQLAIDMRKSGASIRDIEKALKIGRGTISKWCKNIKVNNNGNHKNTPN